MAIILFYISLLSLVAMFAIKYFGISFDHHEAISNLVCENDKQCHKIVHHSRNIFSKIKFENFHKLNMMIIDFIKKEMIYLKRRFDSKQPAFFLSPQKPSHIKKNSVSFFIKNVTDYKNSLRKKDL
jgi:hypothetical protein